MPILKFDAVSLAYGLKPLLDQVSFHIDAGEKICLLGRNGEGKSSLLKLACQQIKADSGDVWVADGLKIGVLQQDLPDKDDRTVFEVVASGIEGLGELIASFHTLSQMDMTDETMKKLAHVQHEIEAKNGWMLNNRVETIVNRLGLPAESSMGDLSGGWKRRVLLGKALVAEPDLLILDEPTNHLDIPAIQWLEDQILQYQGAVLFVSHDRSFIRKISSKILELDRGNLTSWRGTYDQYLIDKQKWLEEEARRNALFDKKLSEEETWIRKGIKARRTRNEGRVRALKALRQERSERIDRTGNVKLDLEKAEISGKVVAEAKHLSFSYDGEPVISDFSAVVLRNDRIGLIGENGCGKSTLVKLLLGELTPNSGAVKQGTNLKVAYFDQSRALLNESMSVADNVAEGREFIDINGKSKHVMGYLNEFLFTSERARTPVSALSGGEKNRLLLAKLFSKPSNVLVLDEPTNDLDVETLELLEDALSDYQGTLIIISHDRNFLDNVVTSTFAFEGNGCVREYVGGYVDWVRQGAGFPSLNTMGSKNTEKPDDSVTHSTGSIKSETEPKQGARPKKLSYKLKKELEDLPGKIEVLESRKAALEAEGAEDGFYQRPHDEVAKVLNLIVEIEAELEVLMDRWVELEAMQE